MQATRREKRSLNKQERVVAVLWQFAHDLQTKEHNCNDGKTSVNLDAVGKALTEIMENFGYQTIEIQ